MNKSAVIIIAIMTLYRLIIFGVTAYAVFWLDRSGWWFLLAALFMGFDFSWTENSKTCGSKK
jgi:hypothetical protein